MKVHFKQPVQFGQKHFPKGVHEVPQEVLKHPYFHKMIQAGLVVDADAAKVVSAKPVSARQKDLIEKIFKAQGKEAPALIESEKKDDSEKSEDAPPSDDQSLMNSESDDEGDASQADESSEDESELSEGDSEESESSEESEAKSSSKKKKKSKR